MSTRFRDKLTYANVMATIAVFVALGGSSYAALVVTSKNVPKNALTGADVKNLTGADVKNETLTGKDVKNGSILAEDLGAGLAGAAGTQGPAGPTGPAGATGPQGAAGSDAQFTGAAAGGDLAGTFPNPTVGPNTLGTDEITDDTALSGGLQAADLRSNSVGASEIAIDSVGPTEVANDTIDAGEVVDFGLSNEDIGVLFAEVNAAATLANQSGGVTVTRVNAVGEGNYEVDFGRNISTCAAVATIGSPTTGSGNGEINVADRSGNVEAVFVDTNDNAGVAEDQPFRLIVVC